MIFLSQSGFGALSSSFYYPYMFLQVPAGLLVVRFGARRLLIAGISLCTLASFLSAFSQEFFWVETARILMGLGAAPTFVCTMALVTRWFPPTLLPILYHRVPPPGTPALGGTAAVPAARRPPDGGGVALLLRAGAFSGSD